MINNNVMILPSREPSIEVIPTIDDFKNALLKKIFPYDTADKKQYSINAYAVERAIIEVAEELSKECPDCKHFIGCEDAVWSGRCEDFDTVRKEDEAYEKGYKDAIKDIEELIRGMYDNKRDN